MIATLRHTRTHGTPAHPCRRRRDGAFISKGYDATTHFETTVDDVLAMYRRITGQVHDPSVGFMWLGQGLGVTHKDWACPCVMGWGKGINPEAEGPGRIVCGLL